MSSPPKTLNEFFSNPRTRTLVRVAMVIIVAASAALVWWSTSKRLVPASRQLRDRGLEMARLGNEIQQLEMKWKPEEIARLEARFNEAQSRAFDSSNALADWRQEAERRAEGFGFQSTSQVAQAKSQSLAGQKLSHMPVSLDLRALDFTRTTNTPYRRLLQFARILESNPKRIDVLDVSVTGNSNSVREAHLNLEAWSRE